MKTLVVMNNSLSKDENGEYIRKAYQPSPGIMYISSYLKGQGFDIDTLNLNHYSSNKLEEVLSENNYDFVGMGGLFIFLDHFKTITETTRRVSPSTKVLLGGQIATPHPEFAMDSVKPDYLVMGEAENVIKDLLDAHENDTDISKVKGIAYLENDQLINTGLGEAPDDLDSLPYPDYEGFEFEYKLDNFPLLDQTAVHPENGRQVGIISSRGCPAKCTFCYLIAGDNVRVRSIDNVIKEIEFLADNYKVNDINVLDDLFCVSKKRMMEFCEKVKPLNIGWQCQLRVNRIDEEMLSEMKATGCYQVSYGFESASPTVLKSMRKGITVSKIENAINLTRKAKMTIQANFIFGDPSETFETANETLKFAKKYKFNRLGKITPYPGTGLYEKFVKGKVKNLEYFYRTSRDDNGKFINMTELTNDEWHFLHRKIVWKEKINREYGKLTKIEKINSIKFKISVICPICSYESKEKIISLSNSKITQYMPKMYCTCSDCRQRFYLSYLDFSDESFFKKLIIRFKYKIAMSRAEITYYSPKIIPFLLFYANAKQFIKRRLYGTTRIELEHPPKSYPSILKTKNNEPLIEKEITIENMHLPFEDNSLSELDVSDVDNTHR